MLLLLWPLPDWLSQRAVWVTGGALGLLTVGGGVILARGRARAGERWRRLVPDHWQRRVSAAFNSLDALRERRTLLRLAMWTGLVWGLAVATNWFVLWALNLEAPLLSGLLVLVVLQAGLSLTTVPATIGIFEYLCVLSLSLFGVEETAALGFGILLHGLVLLPHVIGIFYAWRRGLDVGFVRSSDVPRL